MIRNMNDGSQEPPRLRIDLNLGTLAGLPDHVGGPRPEDAPDELYAAIAEAGYEGVQGGDAAMCRKYGLAAAGSGRINTPEEAETVAKRGADAGLTCSTVHAGWGHENDAEMDRLADAILTASRKYDHPVYVETHRATMLQDTWRCVQLIDRFPALRFNGDFSHWYTGLEMPYGDWEEKLAFLAPVFERVRYMHARLGNSSHMQVSLDHPSMEAAVGHFRDMWTRAMAGFLRSAQPGDVLALAPELLESANNYAISSHDGAGGFHEFGDRWADALAYGKIARQCFAEARKRVGSAE